MAPIIVNVVAALRARGFSNEGTPLLIASTPVSAVHPDANARTSSTTIAQPTNGVTGSTGRSAVTACGRPPAVARTPAQRNISTVSPTKA
jgi:hypothetical protein